MLHILCNKQYLGKGILLLFNAQYFLWTDTVYTKCTQYFRGSILFKLRDTQLFHELGIAYTQFYAEMSGVDIAYTTKYATF